MENFITQYYWIILAAIVWSLPWKAAALWRSARRSHFVWFCVLFLLNSLAILDILYIFVFSKMGKQKEQVAEGDSEYIPRRPIQSQPQSQQPSRTNLM